jgi:hypothetical protein
MCFIDFCIVNYLFKEFFALKTRLALVAQRAFAMQVSIKGGDKIRETSPIFLGKCFLGSNTSMADCDFSIFHSIDHNDIEGSTLKMVRCLLEFCVIVSLIADAVELTVPLHLDTGGATDRILIEMSIYFARDLHNEIL